MNDEIRRLIYELVVEAKGAAKAKEDIEKSTHAMEDMEKTAKKLGKFMAEIFAIREVGKMLGEIQKVHVELKTLGLSSAEAAKGMQQIEDVAVETGSSIAEVAKVYGAAIAATKVLGGTQKDAAALANAFTRAAKAQGKGVAEAAAQIETLKFTIERGKVKVKEFSSLLKENELFAHAAAEAMHTNIKEVLALAEAGQITSADIAKMVEQFKIIGAATEVPTTVEGITNSLLAMATAVIDATAATSGLNDSLAHGTSGWKTFLNILRLVAAILGSLISIAFNVAETFGQMVIAINVAFANAITGNFKMAGNALDLFAQEAKENLADVKRSLDEGQKAFDAVFGDDNAPKPPERQLGNPHEIEEQAFQAMLDKGADLFIESLIKESAEAKKLREQARKETEKEVEQARAAAAARAHAQFEQDEKDRLALAEYYGDLRAKVEKEIQDQNADTSGKNFKLLEKQFEDARQLAYETADTIAGAFENIFTGAIHNAREFFTEILRGMAQIFAARASSQLGDFLKGVFTGVDPSEIHSADGNVFHRGALVPFAGGGVVAGPTTFPMSGGRMGLMGEAGAEAIMPLRRGADGKLGVMGAVPRVEIHNNLGVEANARVDASQDRMRIVLEAAQLGADMAESRVNRSLRTGYGSTAQSVQRTYGLRRRF
jgi:tape measure domain-containing protein